MTDEPTDKTTIRWGSGDHVFSTPPNRPTPTMSAMFEEVSRREKLDRAIRYHWWNTIQTVYYQIGRHPRHLEDRLYRRWSKAQKKWVVTRWARGTMKVSGFTPRPSQVPLNPCPECGTWVANIHMLAAASTGVFEIAQLNSEDAKLIPHTPQRCAERAGKR